MRRLLLALLAGLVLAATAAIAVWTLVQPPPPLLPAPQGVRLDGVTLVEPGLGRREGVSLVVAGGHIASITPGGGSPESSDWRGHVVLPGLIDMHVHFPPDTGLRQDALFALLYLRHGVTAVRDVGDVDGTALPSVRAEMGSGYAGPRLFACGFVDGPDPVWPNSRVVRTPAEADDAVAAVAEAGFDCVKVYERLERETLAAVREAAERRGLPVVGHVPRRVAYTDAGIDDVQHFTRASHMHEVDARPFPQVMDRWREVDEAALDRLVAHALATGTAHTPTLVATERMSRQDEYEWLRQEPDARLLPRLFRDVVWRPSLPRPQLAHLRAYVPVAQRLVKRLHDAGARVHVGTDVLNPFVVPGAGLHRELRLFVEAGLTPEEALALATRGNAADLPLDDLGRLQPGAPADLAVFRRDPTRDLAALDSLVAVVADGRLYQRADLDSQLERYRAWHEGRVFDALSVSLTERAMARLFDERR